MTDKERQAIGFQSAKALLWSSGILVLLGLVIISPADRMFLVAVATICAGISIILGQDRIRVLGILVTLVALILGVASYPDYRKHVGFYFQRAEKGTSASTDQQQTDENTGADNDKLSKIAVKTKPNSRCGASRLS
ncbi:hypothetical protein ACFL0Q_01740 [Thermodesulfobacteriota bacterium]